MYKIGVIGSRETIIGFIALGLSVFPVESAKEARHTLHELAEDGSYAIIYVEEDLVPALQSEIDKYKETPIPAIILIPGRDGSLGLGQNALEEAVKRAVGSNIL